MKIWIVEYSDYDVHVNEGVYSSRELAEVALIELKTKSSKYEAPLYSIEEYDVIDMIE